MPRCSVAHVMKDDSESLVAGMAASTLFFYFCLGGLLDGIVPLPPVSTVINWSLDFLTILGRRLHASRVWTTCSLLVVLVMLT